MNNERPSNERLTDILFDDMKKMNSVIEDLTRQVNDLRIKTENVPNDMKMMDSILKDLTRQVHHLEAQLRNGQEGLDEKSR